MATEIIEALQKLCVETGSLACLGCGYEHNCGIHGCKIIRAAIAEIDSLRTQLSASQRREKAAVADLSASTKCSICKYLPKNGTMADCLFYASCGLAYLYFEWRGPQEGKHEE